MNISNVDSPEGQYGVCRGFKLEQIIHHLVDDYEEISGHLFIRILDIFEVHYAVKCVDTITELTFDSFKDLEKTTWIFKKYTLEDLENIINHADSNEHIVSFTL